MRIFPLIFLIALPSLSADEWYQEPVDAGKWYQDDFYTPDVARSSSRQFAEDRITLGLITGFVFSPIGLGPDHDSFNYTLTNIRLGWMLNSPSGNGFFLDGNFEAIIELSGSWVTNDWGEIIIGPTALIRYNFVQPGWVVVPYIQGGAGVVYTNAHEEPGQTTIGQALEFTPQASVGLRFLIDDNWTLETEAILHHISNAGLSDQNGGINAVGGMIGFTYFFDKLWK